METTTSLEIRNLTEWDALYCQYPGQTNQQDCYLELDCRTGLLTATYNAEIGNAIPFSVYHGHDRRWGIPCLTADAANALMAEIAPLAERVLAGYRGEFDGNNVVARLSEDAVAAEAEIESVIDALHVDETNGVSGVEADEWLADCRPDITADTTDEELRTLAAKLEAEAAVEHMVLNVTDWLTEQRQSLRNDRDE